MRLFAAILLSAFLLFAQSGVENFDLTGLPPKATNFAEQHLMDMINHHKAGDIGDAAVIQRTLAQYYRQKGDAARARVADERAGSAGQIPQASSNTAALAGDYLCRSMGSGPCDTQTTISLHDDGTWGWRFFSGKYEIQGNRVTFRGPGLGSWGPAVVGPNSLTFMNGASKVIWEKPSAAPPALAGTYVCATAAGGGPCQTRYAVELRPDGTWSWGVQRGSYTILGGHIKFTGGLTTGPSAWGEADAESGALIFRSSYGPSVWRKR